MMCSTQYPSLSLSLSLPLLRPLPLLFLLDSLFIQVA